MKHSPLPFLKGQVIMTEEIRRTWTPEEIKEAKTRESFSIFSGFSFRDIGKSRKLVCTVRPSEGVDDVKFLCVAANNHDDLVAIVKAVSEDPRSGHFLQSKCTDLLLRIERESQ